ncbi:alpha/beta fold hydrolase [Pontibacter sp. G13]|uniref:alpha/beta fold hydrolase n=1 Tax=Pontibacter sp. G13 TaxID=3074898 RepID=UPI00288C53D7|nr:alpha/beta fold hydrolase [Pontibacter sp. G13]WNJ21307.1 alpha/beta fold hydrolase [Pontibacter sp. G13]
MKPLLLLHGAIGAQDQLQPLASLLKDDYEVHTLNFFGHGGNPLTDEPFRISTFAYDVLGWMANQGIEQIDLFGYSMGGYVALYLAKNFPEKVGKIMTLGTKFDWTPEGAAKEVKMLNPDVILEKVPKFAQVLEQRHAPQDWKIVLQKTAEMMLHLGNQPDLTQPTLEAIDHPVVIGVGDKDKMAGLPGSNWAYEHLPNAHLMVLPETPHPIEKVNLEPLAYHALQFFG